MAGEDRGRPDRGLRREPVPEAGHGRGSGDSVRHAGQFRSHQFFILSLFSHRIITRVIRRQCRFEAVLLMAFFFVVVELPALESLERISLLLLGS